MPDINVIMCENIQNADNSVLSFRIIKLLHQRKTKMFDTNDSEKYPCPWSMEKLPYTPIGRIIYPLASTCYGHAHSTAGPAKETMPESYSRGVLISGCS